MNKELAHKILSNLEEKALKRNDIKLAMECSKLATIASKRS